MLHGLGNFFRKRSAGGMCGREVELFIYGYEALHNFFEYQKTILNLKVWYNQDFLHLQNLPLQHSRSFCIPTFRSIYKVDMVFIQAAYIAGHY